MQPSNKPLAYPCLEHVLRSLGAELRIELSVRCPGIRTVDKNIPIKLRHIMTYGNGLKINNTTYTVGVIRHYLGGYQPPQWVQKNNLLGGVVHDCCFQDKNNYWVKKRMLKDRAPSDEEVAQCFKNRQMLQEALTKLNWESIPSERKLLEIKIEDLRTKIRNYNEQLAISELKFEYYLMLTINKDGVKRRELLYYNVPIGDAIEYLAEKLIGKRRIICNDISIYGGQNMYSNNFSIKNSKQPEHVIEVDEWKIKSIEVSWCNAKFEQIQKPELIIITPSLIEFKFYILESALDDTIESIHKMEQPRKREKLGREDFSLTSFDHVFSLYRESYLPTEYDFIIHKWIFTFLIMKSKLDLPEQKYYVNICGKIDNSDFRFII